MQIEVGVASAPKLDLRTFIQMLFNAEILTNAVTKQYPRESLKGKGPLV